jgi:GTP cyclohydrolase I
MEDFESSLQVLRGFETDISAEVNEIKVTTSYRHHFVAVRSYVRVALIVSPANLFFLSNMKKL